jgi:hypothetical protein
VNGRGYELSALWSRAGDYTGPLEDLSGDSPTDCYVLSDVDVVAQWGRSEPRATSDTAAGSMTFALTNIDRQFSPENTSSPIAGDVLPGVPARLRARNPVDGSAMTVFQGPISEFEVDPTAPAKDFTAVCSDGWGKPGDTKLSMPVYQGKRTGDLIQLILDEIGWPGQAYRAIDWGATVIPFWWAEDVDAQTAIQDLVHSEGTPSMAWVENGVFNFRDRHHRVTLAPSLTSQGTYTHTIPAGAVPNDHKILAGSFRYNHGLDHIVNTATLEVTPRVPDVLQVVWSTDDPIMLSANESTTLIIRTDDPFIDLQTPSAAFDSNGNGIIESDYDEAIGSLASVSLSRTSGQSAFLTITAGISGVLLDTGIKVRGRPLKQGPARLLTSSDPTSQAVYGDQDWGGAAPWAYYYDADAIVDRLVTVYSQPAPSVTFDIDGSLDSDTLWRILNTHLSDRITVRNDELGLNADYMIEQVSHTVKRLGDQHILTVGAQIAESYQASQPFTFDTATPTVNGFGNGRFGLSAGGMNPATMFRFDTASPTTQGFGNGVFAT